MIRVALIDDQTLVRKGIAGLLELTDDIRVVAQAGSAAEGFEVVQQQQPDVVLLDVRMPHGSGLDLLARLASSPPFPPCILLTTFDDDEALLRGLRLGARGFLLKDVTLEQLAESIRQVVAGGTAVRTGITDRVVQSVSDASDASGAFDALTLPDPLTMREREILSLMATGLSNREIADVLGNSEGTVKNQVSSILSKLGVRDRVRAVLRGIDLGLI